MRNQDLKAERLRQRFKGVSRQREWRGRRLWARRPQPPSQSQAGDKIGLYVVGAVLLLTAVGVVSASPWPALITIKHYAASRNCATARSLGLAPASRGKPGYWPHLDADDDGVACEPWP
jgi:hypothetical protein